MRLSQRNRGLGSYIEVIDHEIENNYKVGMLRNNNIGGLLEPVFYAINNKLTLMFKVDGYNTVRNMYMSKSPDSKDVKKLIADLADCIGNIEKYLLQPEELCLELNNIVYNKETNTYLFLYIPGVQSDFKEKLKKLFEEIMIIYDHTNNDDVVFLYKLYSKLLEGNFTRAAFQTFVRDFAAPDQSHNDNPVENKKPENPSPPYENISNEAKDEASPAVSDRRLFIRLFWGIILLVIALSIYYFFGKYSIKFIALLGIIYAVIFYVAGIRNEDAEIEKSMQEYFKVEKQANKESENITTYSIVSSDFRYDPFLLSNGDNIVGRRHKDVNICISAEGISRKHAIINVENEELKVCDLGSTNGTFLNSKKLEPMDWQVVKNNDFLSFATEEFYVLKNE